MGYISPTNPNSIDRNASSPTRIRRTMQRLSQGAATGTIKVADPINNTGLIGLTLASNPGLQIVSHGLSVKVNPAGAITLGASGIAVAVDGTVIAIVSDKVSLANQSANLILAGPTTGAAALPTFRTLVANDIPGTLNATTFGGDLTLSAHNLITDTTTGTKIGTSATQKLGAFGATPIVRPAVTGSRGGNVALASLLTALANLGWITDSTTV